MNAPSDHQRLAEAVAAVDVGAVVELILNHPRRGAIGASTVAIIALAQRILDLEEIAAGTAELLAALAALQSPAADVVRNTEPIFALTQTLSGALQALGYRVEEEHGQEDQDAGTQPACAAD